MHNIMLKKELLEMIDRRVQDAWVSLTLAKMDKVEEPHEYVKALRVWGTLCSLQFEASMTTKAYAKILEGGE
jgi:hypothetical protein